ncbi:GAF domain-containing protein [Rathayibacter sp. VKM Ac-2803]|nr:GAF domain-containing protein [Rathayibacter sp. VKM Ac-2803]
MRLHDDDRRSCGSCADHPSPRCLVTGAATARSPDGDDGDGDAGELAPLLASFVTMLPVDDAAASTLSDPFDPEVLVATSTRAGALDEAQIDLGEGPAWRAYRSGRPVELHVSRAEDVGSWPFFCSDLAASEVQSVLCVPLVLGTLGVGAVSLYCDAPVVFEREDLHLAKGLAAVLACAIIAQALERAQSGAGAHDAALSRREVHQATGMVFSQTGSSTDEALLMIRAHAFATGTTVREVASRVVARTLDFTPDAASDDGK